jgi:hypothetical protein
MSTPRRPAGTVTSIPIGIRNAIYVEIRAPYFVGNSGEAGAPVGRSREKTTSSTTRRSTRICGPRKIRRAPECGPAVPFPSPREHVPDFSTFTRGGVALRLETNPTKTGEGIESVVAANISGARGVNAVDLSAHSLYLTDGPVMRSDSNRRSPRNPHHERRRIRRAGGGRVSARIDNGGVVAGAKAQIPTRDDMRAIGRSLSAIDRGRGSPQLHVTVDHAGGRDPFGRGAGSLVDIRACPAMSATDVPVAQEQRERERPH